MLRNRLHKALLPSLLVLALLAPAWAARAEPTEVAGAHSVATRILDWLAGAYAEVASMLVSDDTLPTSTYDPPTLYVVPVDGPQATTQSDPAAGESGPDFDPNG